tara:strand:- start:971 stop:1285 length:315 start_codon:yes stop_codon:yes gene_type:complete
MVLKLLRKDLLHSKKSSILTLLIFALIVSYSGPIFSSQDNYLEEVELNNTKDGYESNTTLPTNPFEIVEMLRKANSMNDATNPSDALDEALKSFENLKLNDNKY